MGDPMGSNMRRSLEQKTVLIAASGTNSETVVGGKYAMYGLICPSALTGSAIHFEVSPGGGTFYDLYDASNAQVTVTIGTSRAYDLPAELCSWPYWRFVSNGTEADVRSFTVVCKS